MINTIAAILAAIILYKTIKYIKLKIKIYLNIKRSKERAKQRKQKESKTNRLNKTGPDMEDKFKYTITSTLIEQFTDELIIECNKEKELTKQNFELIITKLRRKFNIIPKKNQILNVITNNRDKYKEPDVKYIQNMLITKAMRGLSGVDIATIVLKPSKFSCPEKCAFCPTEYDAKTGKLSQPKSYLSSEPAMMRANEYHFAIIGQIWDRILTYIINGNVKDGNGTKLEIIVSGGTWESYPLEYRNEVILLVYYAANIFPENNKELIYKILNELRAGIYEIDVASMNIRAPLSLNEEQHINTKESKNKIIGLTIETRPDYITTTSIKLYNKWGITRVQLGIQSIYDDVLDMNDRGHKLVDAINAIRLLKVNCFKTVVHIMPDLYGTTPKKDLEMFKELIRNPDLQFNDIKIYPCAICKSHDETKYRVESKIMDLYEKGIWKPYSEDKDGLDKLIKILCYYKSRVQPWVRIQRVVRDIPDPSILKGYNHCVNLRNYLNKLVVCNCIRCKEIKDNKVNSNEIIPVVYKYPASNGTEYFIAFQYHNKNVWFYLAYLLFFIKSLLNKISNKIFNRKRVIYFQGCNKSYKYIIGFCRLRLPSNNKPIFNILENAGLIIELHVYSMAIMGQNKDYLNLSSYQHMGYGQKLMNIAESIAKENGCKSMAVIAGVGVRDYYENKCGYKLNTGYMIKEI
jgi:ELP3 family radical SAM enzyme/protein acetyltransferase